MRRRSSSCLLLLVFSLVVNGSHAFVPPFASSIASRRRGRHHHDGVMQGVVSALGSETTSSNKGSSASASASTLHKKKNDSTSWIQEELQRDGNSDTSRETSRSSRVVVGPQHVQIYDTTLRDGTQGESVSASAADKLKICRRLAEFDVDYIEAGWPGSNPKDAEFFSRAAQELPEKARRKLVAFGSTRRKNVVAQQDAQVQALVESAAPTVCIVAKAHAWQVTEILKAELEENLNMIRDTVSYLTQQAGRNVMVDLEHFFDGYQSDPDYALQCCQAAADAGASCLVLCDTNGGTMPWEIGNICRAVVQQFVTDHQVTIGIHCHNDCGMAVANSVTACHEGVGLIQGTINGIGERTGNADLCSIIPSLALHVDTQMTCQDHLAELTQMSRFVDEILNRTPHSAAPFVGASAFAHKGGLHVAAMKRSPLSYQHIEPEKVGNEQRVLISELSGRQNILGKMQQAGVDIAADTSVASERALAILNRVKQLESVGYTFEGADASVHLMILHATKGYCPPFQVLDYAAQVYDANMDSASRVLAHLHTDANNNDSCQSQGLGPTARATIKVRTVKTTTTTPDDNDDDDMGALPFEDHLEVSDGTGPVDALANALKRALLPSQPSLKCVELVDYKVRILDPAAATAASTRVMIEFQDCSTEHVWTTVSVDKNVISASLNALIDGYEFFLLQHAADANGDAAAETMCVV